MLHRLLATARTAIAVPTFFLFTLAVAAYVSVVSRFAPHHRYLDRVVRFWSRRFLRIAPLSLDARSAAHLDPDRQYVFVSNHLSNFDIPVLFLAIPHRIRYMAKKELFKIPFLAGAMRRIGIIKIDRNAGASIHAAINEGVAAARAHGYSLIVFPEGTRSRDGGLHPFKKGAFRIAIANELDVVPVAIRGTWEIWRPDARVFYPGHATVVIGDPISVAGLTLGDIDMLREKAHDAVEAALTTMTRPGD